MLFWIGEPVLCRALDIKRQYSNRGHFHDLTQRGDVLGVALYFQLAFGRHSVIFLVTLFGVIFLFFPNNVIVRNLHPSHAHEAHVDHEPQDVRDVAFEGLFGELYSFNNGLTLEHIPQWVDDIGCGGLNLPVCN
jgi:hypothetical protein